MPAAAIIATFHQTPGIQGGMRSDPLTTTEAVVITALCALVLGLFIWAIRRVIALNAAEAAALDVEAKERAAAHEALLEAISRGEDGLLYVTAGTVGTGTNLHRPSTTRRHAPRRIYDLGPSEIQA